MSEGEVYVDEDSTCGFTWSDEMTDAQRNFYRASRPKADW